MTLTGSVVSNAVEASWQHVEEKAPDAFRRAERHRLLTLLAIGSIVLVAKAHVPVVDVEQPLVGDGAAMGIAADIVEYLLRTGVASRRPPTLFATPPTSRA
jgi:hypothetical protein